MYNIIPLIIIFSSLFVIILVVTRRFSELANIDVDSIPEEKASRMKERIISNRLKREYLKWWSFGRKLFIPLFGFFGDAARKWYGKLHEVREKAKGGEMVDKNLSDDDKDSIFGQAKALIKIGDWDEAEKKLIEIISSDPKSIVAFKLLGKVYCERKAWGDARQTIEHVIRVAEKELDSLYVSADGSSVDDKKKQDELTIQLSGLYYDLSRIAWEVKNYTSAMAEIRKALKIEPNNPRYLDTKLEISIIKKDRIAAEKTLAKLQQINPENQKIKEWEEEIKFL